MTDIVIYTMITISSIGVIAAIILYFVAQKFNVIEDPRIDLVEEALPSANCGGCGLPGCRPFAEACVDAENFDNLYCPVGGNDVMAAVGKILEREVSAVAAKIAVVRCNGTPEFRAETSIFEGSIDGKLTCAMEHALYGGHTDCTYGCLGGGDCVDVCGFDAIHINPLTKLPEVIDDKCTACNACVIACPKDIIELRTRNKKDRKIFVSCINMDKGAPAKKACAVACIGCSKCFKVCPYDAIRMANNLAFIDSDACKLCRKCVTECPTNAIIEIGFPERKIKAEVKDDLKKTVTKTEPVEQTINLTDLAKENNQDIREDEA